MKFDSNKALALMANHGLTFAEVAERGDIDAFCDSFIDLLYGKSFAEKTLTYVLVQQ